MTKPLNSRAFKDGFAKGFSSPYLFLLGERKPITRPGLDVNARAWLQVGRYLDLALQEEAKRVVEDPAKIDARRDLGEKLSA